MFKDFEIISSSFDKGKLMLCLNVFFVSSFSMKVEEKFSITSSICAKSNLFIDLFLKYNNLN